MSLIADLPLGHSRLRLGLQHVVFVDRHARKRRPMNLCPSTHHELTHADPAPSIDQSVFVRWLFDKAGLNVNHYSQQTLRRRIHACLRSLHVGSCSEARRVLESSPRLIPVAISALVIGVTSFFRDAPVFDCLRETFVGHQEWQRTGFRIWSAACSDGSELYSVAMLLADAGLLHRAQLLGTDCRPDAIVLARNGIYSASTMRTVDPAILRRYFHFESAGYRIAGPLRQATQWRAANILSDPEPGKWNVILCRNMAMYLKPEVAGALWRQLESLLVPGGLLILGKAERPGGTRLSMVAPCVYRLGPRIMHHMK